MSQSTSQSRGDKVRWTAADLELFPDNGNRYEIVDGDLLVTRAPTGDIKKPALGSAQPWIPGLYQQAWVKLFRLLVWSLLMSIM